jgi:hypothetical protein
MFLRIGTNVYLSPATQDAMMLVWLLLLAVTLLCVQPEMEAWEDHALRLNGGLEEDDDDRNFGAAAYESTREIVGNLQELNVDFAPTTRGSNGSAIIS